MYDILYLLLVLTIVIVTHQVHNNKKLNVEFDSKDKMNKYMDRIRPTKGKGNKL